MRIEGGSIPFHIARAYGVQASPKTAAVRAALQPEGSREVALGAGARKLVGGAVPGKINFVEGEAIASAGLPMYRHPADKNAAATAVGAGRLVDVTG